MRKAFMSLSFALAALSAALLAAAAPARADGTINLIDLAELSGSGATVGTNFKNGVDLAVEEINAKGGILGAKIVVTHVDTQSNAGVAKGLAEKALDSEPYALLGPGYSGFGQGRRAARRRGGHCRDHGRRGRRTDPAPATSFCSAPRSASSRACRRSPNTSPRR